MPRAIEEEYLLVVRHGEKGTATELTETVDRLRATLTDLGDGRTEMAMRATVHTTDEMRGAAEGGLASAFDRLAEHLEQR